MKTNMQEHWIFISCTYCKHEQKHKIHTCGLSRYFNQPPSQPEPSFLPVVWSWPPCLVKEKPEQELPTGLRLLLNHLQKDVSYVSAGAEGVSYSATSSGSNQVQRQMLLTILPTLLASCPFGTNGINICIIVIMCCQTLATEVNIKIN